MAPTPVLLPRKSHGQRSLEGCSPWGRWRSDMTEQLHFHFHALEKEMATHSSVLTWRIPGTGEPGGLPPMGSHRVGHNWSDLAAAAGYRESTCNSGDHSSIPGLGRYAGEGKVFRTPVFWPGEFHGLHSPWGCKESDMTEWLTLHLCLCPLLCHPELHADLHSLTWE